MLGKQNKYFFLSILLIIILNFVLLTRKYSKNILSEKVSSVAITIIPSLTVEPTPRSTLTPTITRKPSLKPTTSPRPTSLPKSASSEEINRLIDQFSEKYSLSPHVVRHVAICESGFNSSAVQKNYVGLFQFAPATWKNIRREMNEDINIDLRFSATESVKTATYILSKGKSTIWPNCFPKN